MKGLLTKLQVRLSSWKNKLVNNLNTNKMKKTSNKIRKEYMIKFLGNIFYLKSLKIVKAILIDNPQQVLIRTITYN